MTESQTSENTVEAKPSSPSEFYPGAKVLLKACEQDVMKIDADNKKLYDRLNYALAFSGLILTVALNTLDFSFGKICVSTLTLRQLSLLMLAYFCQYAGLVVLIGAIIRMLFLMRGRELRAFRCEVIREEEHYKEKEEDAAAWLICHYGEIAAINRPIVEEKHRSFNRTMVAVAIGLIFYLITLFIMKGAFGYAR